MPRLRHTVSTFFHMYVHVEYLRHTRTCYNLIMYSRTVLYLMYKKGSDFAEGPRDAKKLLEILSTASDHEGYSGSRRYCHIVY